MLFGFTYKAFGRSSNTTIMWHTVAMIRLTSSLTIESNWMTSLWGSYAIQNQCFCLTKRTKHFRKQLYATWVTNNWGKLPFVIIVTWRENIEGQPTLIVINICDSERGYQYFFVSSKSMTPTTLWTPSANFSKKDQINNRKIHIYFVFFGEIGLSRHVPISSINFFRQNIRQSNQRGHHLQIFSSQSSPHSGNDRIMLHGLAKTI